MSEGIVGIGNTNRMNMFVTSCSNVKKFMIVSEHKTKVGWYSIVYKYVPELPALHMKHIIKVLILIIPSF